MRSMVDWVDSEIFADAGSTPLLGALGGSVRVERFGALEEIFQEGDEARDVYILKSGKVELAYTLPTRRDESVRIKIVKPGELFAWSALAGSRKLTARATALEDSEAYLIPAEKLRGLMESHPEFGYRIMSRLTSLIASRLRDTRQQLQWLNSPH